MSRKPKTVNPVGSGMAWVEEAAAWLRRARLEDWALYYIGAVPFCCALLWYFSEMAYSAFAEARLPTWSLVMPLMYVWMKCWHCVFCRRLIERHTSETPERWSAGRVWRMILFQGMIQPVGLLVTTVTAQVVIPYIFAYSFFAAALVLADGAKPGLRRVLAESWAQARLWVGEAHSASGVLFLCAVLLFANFLSFAVLVIMLGHGIMGQTGEGTRSLGEILNTTTISVLAVATYLAFDPFRKALYAVRAYHASARTNGTDLRVDLARALRAARAVACVALFLLPTTFVHGAGDVEPIPPASLSQGAPTSHEQLDRALDEVFEGKDFAWRMPREKVKSEVVESELNAFLKRISDGVRDVIKWLDKVFSKAPKANLPNMSGPDIDFAGLMKALGYIIIVAAVGGLLYLAVKAIRAYRAQPQFEGAFTAVPDIRSEHVSADQLPEDGWLAIASEMAAAGDFRLALRAIYLAALAHLGGRALLTLARHKSNRDYTVELTRRTRGHDLLHRAFRTTIEGFERSWYGLHPVDAPDYAAARETFETLRTC